jgi:hypothetical protein
MAVSVQPIGDGDLARVAEFFHAHLNQRVPADAWVAAFTPPWTFEQPNHGFMLLEDAGAVVGAYAALYSERTLEDRQERICNLAAWCVREDQRFHSLRLLKALLAQEGYTFTDLSPSGNVVPLNARLGFTELDPTTVLVPTLPWPPRRGVRVSSDPEAVGAALTGVQRDLYRDHARLAGARHAILVEGDRSCWVVFRMDRRKQLPPVFASILHVSDQDLFRRRVRAVGSHLMLHHRAAALLAERRVTGPLAVWPRFTLGAPRRKMFLSSTMSVDEVDYFYSELTCLSW